MDLKRWTLLVTMIGALLVTAFANDKDEIVKNREDQLKERIAFFKENIKPKVDAQRNKLEPSISPEDKNEINRLRGEIIKQRLMENEFIFEARAARIKGEGFDEGLWQEIGAQRIVIENLQDQAKLIANKYRPEIDALVADLREDLREERGNIDPRWGGSGQGYGNDRRGHGNANGFNSRSYRQGPQTGAGTGPGFNRGFGPQDFDHDFNGRLNIVAFLLWDVNRG